MAYNLQQDGSDMLPLITEYRFGSDTDAKNHCAIYISYRGNDRWVVTDKTEIVSRSGNWMFNHSPSNCSDEFINETRFTLEEALRIGEQVYNNLKRL